MEHGCAACTDTPNIRISNLDYCNACFESQFLRKVFRCFRKLRFGSRVLLYLDGTSSSLVMAHAISRLKNRSIHEFTVMSRCFLQHRAFLEGIGFSNQVDAGSGLWSLDDSHCAGRINPLPRQAVEAARSSGFDMVVFQADAETESVVALRSVCRGSGVEETIESCISKISGLRVRNALGRIKRKEVGYYHYINRKEIPGSLLLSPMSGMELILSRFVSRMESRNSLVLFNILNTVKKVVADRDGIDTSD